MMSIRLRLTLMYSTILALTLIVFGVALYSIQARDTLSSLKQDITLSSQKLVGAILRPASASPRQESPGQNPPPPRPPDQNSGVQAFDQAFLALPENEIARLLDANGNMLASPFNRDDDTALPLSAAGLTALQKQQDWWETADVSGETMLIYSHPVVQDGETAYIVQVARSLTERDRTLKSLATTLGGAGLLTLLIAFGAGWLLSGLTLSPINRITHTAQKIGDDRDFTRRVAYDGPQDEVGQLANTFNEMLVRLQDAYQKVEHSLQMQRNFVADVSHELRTPLTTLRGNLGLLGRNPPAPPDEQADILADMVHESDRMIRLVNDLLELARADAGRNLAREPFAIQPVLEETVRQAHQLDEKRKITLKVSQNVSILGDRDAFKQVMLILLDNALKHSDGEIHVKASVEGEQVGISVEDQGHGISPAELERIFDRFYRGHDNPDSSGFGLGLPIAKALVDAMAGSITIESEVGKGSTVILRFSTS